MRFWTHPAPAGASSSSAPEENSTCSPTVNDFKKFHNSKTTNTSNAATELPLLPMPVVSKQPLVDSASRKRRKSVQISGGLQVRWAAFKKRVGTGTAPSTSSVLDGSIGDSIAARGKAKSVDAPEGEVDEVIVDRVWADEITNTSIAPSQSAGSLDKVLDNPLGGTNIDHESATPPESLWTSSILLVMLRWRVWPGILRFFRVRFVDEKSEAHYRKESWFFRKNLGIWSALFFIINWMLAIAFIPKPLVLADKIFYYAIGPVVSIPVFVMVMYDFPRDRPGIYQLFLTVATWSWAMYQVLFMYFCGFYDTARKHTDFTCGTKDFLSLFYYTSAVQTIALFGLNLNRFPALVGALLWFIVSCSLLIPDRVVWVRQALNFLAFQAFLLYVHYMRENVERRLYTLRDQLKIQFKATQKAQVNERKAADSKRRLTSYVRVPLNTALLAVQNMSAYGAVAKSQEIEFNALQGSLNMMSKVLNDVLDFHRLDSGKFESLNRPYAFHQVMRSLFVPLRLDTDSRKLEFVTQLDKSIDDVARTALYYAVDQSAVHTTQDITDNNEADGIVVGDETRLRQIITNLAGNACKFTPTGGKITISTKLILPSSESLQTIMGPALCSETRKSLSSSSDVVTHNALSADHVTQHNTSVVKPQLDWIVVRIEVSDTGYGIQRKDMVKSKLFTAFNQTEQGRQQGGKGTGLGLALVRQIVKFSGGRLGVKSKVGLGSTFWVELPLAVGKKALPLLSQSARPSLDRLNSDRIPQPPPSTPDTGGRSSENMTFLEHVTNPDGLVQLVPRNRGVDRDSVRTTGGEQFGSIRPFASFERPSSVESSLPSTSQDEHKTTFAPRGSRPQHLDLPRPSLFNLDGTLRERSPSTSLSPTLPPGSTPCVDFESGLRVLVVDDDRLTRMLMERMLERLKCVVTTAVNGREALKLLLGDSYSNQFQDEDNIPMDDSLENENSCRTAPEDHTSLHLERYLSTEEGKFAIVFLDNQMPVLSGVETVLRLRQAGRQDLVVGITGNALLPDQEEYLEAGVDHVLTKPVREENVRAMLSIASDRRKYNRSLPASSP